MPLIKISEDPDNANTDMENSNQIGKDPINSQIEKSRRFSKLPPAPKDSPNAVKLGSKFTKIEILNEPSIPIQSKFLCGEFFKNEISKYAKGPSINYVGRRGDRG